MRGSWTFQIKQMVTDVMNYKLIEIMDCHTGHKTVGYSKCPKQEGSFGFTQGIDHLRSIQKSRRQGRKRNDPIQAQMDTQKPR